MDVAFQASLSSSPSLNAPSVFTQTQQIDDPFSCLDNADNDMKDNAEVRILE